MNLAAGEKSLTRLVSLDGQLLATTYRALTRATPDPCLPDVDSQARFYRMDIATARPHEDPRTDDEGRRRRHVTLPTTGIPSAPTVIFPKGSSTAQIIVDRRRVAGIEQRLARVYWHAK